MRREVWGRDQLSFRSEKPSAFDPKVMQKCNEMRCPACGAWVANESVHGPTFVFSWVRRCLCGLVARSSLVGDGITIDFPCPGDEPVERLSDAYESQHGHLFEKVEPKKTRKAPARDAGGKKRWVLLCVMMALAVIAFMLWRLTARDAVTFAFAYVFGWASNVANRVADLWIAHWEQRRRR